MYFQRPWTRIRGSRKMDRDATTTTTSRQHRRRISSQPSDEAAFPLSAGLSPYEEAFTAPHRSLNAASTVTITTTTSNTTMGTSSPPLPQFGQESTPRDGCNPSPLQPPLPPPARSLDAVMPGLKHSTNFDSPLRQQQQQQPTTGVRVHEKHARKDSVQSSPADGKKPSIGAFVRQITRTSSIGADLGITEPEGAPTWLPTWLRPSPLAGVVALLIVICCTLASLGILVGSNGKHVDDWTWSPSVFLAISSAAIGKSLQFALLQALPIAWWYRAYRGSTIDSLQRHWESGQGICRAILNARHEPILAMAMIAGVLVVADGPFLQKASSVKSEFQNTTVTLNFPVAPELPTGFSGIFSENGLETTDAITPALDGFTLNTTLVANVTGCNGACRATIRAPGVTISNCTSRTWDLTPKELQHNRSATWGSGVANGVAPMPLFNIQLADNLHSSPDEPPYVGPEEVILQTGIANFSDCTGSYVERHCALVAAILEHDVMVQEHNVIRFLRPPSEGKVVAMANNTYVNSSAPLPLNLTISGLGAFLAGHVFANATMEPADDARETGSEIMPGRHSFNNVVDSFTISSNLCLSQFADPTTAVLDQFNNLMFRAAIEAAKSTTNYDHTSPQLDPGLALSQSVSAAQTRRVNVFASDLRWWSGAALLELLAVVAILPVFWGYWRLGLRVTMSPFEIAKAFEAPLLKEVGSASGSRGVVKGMGDVRVKFGTADEQYERSGDDTGADEEEKGCTTGTLVIGEADDVTTPRTGTQFM